MMHSTSNTSHNASNVRLCSRGQNTLCTKYGWPAFVATAVVKLCSIAVTSVWPRSVCVKCTADTIHNKKMDRKNDRLDFRWPSTGRVFWPRQVATVKPSEKPRHRSLEAAQLATLRLGWQRFGICQPHDRQCGATTRLRDTHSMLSSQLVDASAQPSSCITQD